MRGVEAEAEGSATWRAAFEFYPSASRGRQGGLFRIVALNDTERTTHMRYYDKAHMRSHMAVSKLRFLFVRDLRIIAASLCPPLAPGALAGEVA